MNEYKISLFPNNLMYGHAYVPNQVMDRIYNPEDGLKKGTIFPELVQNYFPGQSMKVIDTLSRRRKL